MKKHSPKASVMTHVNALGQPIGSPLPPFWHGAKPPRGRVLEGSHVRLEPLDPMSHASGLFAAFREDRRDQIWTYLPYGPFKDVGEYQKYLESHFVREELQAYTLIVEPSGNPQGLAAYLRIKPSQGSIEIGHICLAPALQRTAAATEAMFLMMQHVFEELDYRRYEWKCDALNEASRCAAERLGFIFEGVFRQATFYKGRNRDTAWFSVVDHEWPGLRKAYQTWLAPTNFDGAGQQHVSLSMLIRSLRVG